MSYYFLLRPVANSEVSRHKSLFEEKVSLFSTSWKLFQVRFRASSLRNARLSVYKRTIIEAGGTNDTCWPFTKHYGHIMYVLVDLFCLNTFL